MAQERQFNTLVKTFDPNTIVAIAKVMGDTANGLTGSEIGRFLGQSQIPDIDSNATKWSRLYNALASFQNEHRVGNHIIIFIHNSMNPALYVRDEGRFSWLLCELNTVLKFEGYRISDDGKIRKGNVATTISQAKERENSLRKKLEIRNSHNKLFEYCKSELLEENHFHATFESVKSVTSRLREMSGVDGDGEALINNIFSFSDDKLPIVAINLLNTSTLKGEQRGFTNLLKGLYGTFRNPLGHEARIEWEMHEDDALDIMSLVSLIHRKLDKSHIIKK